MKVPRVCFGGFVLALAVALATIDCGDGTGPGREPEISNTTDSFELQITDVRDYSRNVLYSWENTGSVADVNQASSVTAGSVTLRIYDDDDREVYSRSLTENGSFATGSGTTGTWTILVVFADASGTVNFRVEKRP